MKIINNIIGLKKVFLYLILISVTVSILHFKFGLINIDFKIFNFSCDRRETLTPDQILQLETSVNSELQIFKNTIKTKIGDAEHQYSMKYNKIYSDKGVGLAEFQDLRNFIEDVERESENNINKFITDINSKYVIPYNADIDIRQDTDFMNIKKEANEFVRNTKNRFNTDLKRSQIEERYVKPLKTE